MSGHTEVSKNFTLGTVFGGATTMTLVDNDHIKKIPAEFAVGVLVLIVVGEALIQCQINFKGFVDLFIFDHRHLVFEMPEIATPGLIYQGIAVCQKENTFFRTDFPKAMNNLKGSIGFTGAGRHGKQDALLTFSNGLDRAVDSNLLVIARASAGAVEKIILGAYAFGFRRGDTFIFFITLPQLRR